MTATNEYREEMKALLIKVDTRQEEIFHRIGRIEVHLEKLNSKVALHEADLVKVKTVGTICVIAVPLILNLIMRLV